MISLRQFASRFSALFRKHHLEQDMNEEMRAHLEMLIEENVRRGMSPEEARYAALRSFGGVEQIKENYRDQRGLPIMEPLLHDIRFGLRQLRRNPGFAAVAVFTLALGIGATTAIFSVVDAVLLHAQPFQRPKQLVALSERSPQGEKHDLSVGSYSNFQEQAQSLQGVAAYTHWEFHTLTGVGEPDEVWTSAVTTNLFALLGIHAVLGRTFISNDTQSAVLSYRYWRSHFSAKPSIIGMVVKLDGKPYAIVGVAPPDFEFPASNAQMWVPLVFSAADLGNYEREDKSTSIIARLKAGVTVKQAQAEADTIAHRLALEFPKTNAGWGIHVEQYQQPELSGILRAALFALIGAVLFVQSIVCANVASMLFARGCARQGEMAIRAALGAGRLRLIRQQLMESLLLSGSASVAGLVLAWSGLHLIISLVPRYTNVQTQGMDHAAINLPVLGFTMLLSLLTGIVVGLLPALRVVNVNQALKEGGRTSGTSSRRSGLQRALIVSEVALAFVLLVGAGLMIQSFKRLAAAPIGFNPNHVLTVRVPLAKFKYKEGPQSANFYAEVLQRIQAIPGVKSVGMANNLPFTGFHVSGVVDLPRDSSGGPSGHLGFAMRDVSPGYFQAMGIPLNEGRDFTKADGASNARCVWIINEAMARRSWPGEDAIGKQLRNACRGNASALVVGVVGDSKQDSVTSKADSEVFIPYGQHPFASFLATFVVRTASNPLDLAHAVRNAIWEVDHDQPVIEIRTMENVVLESIWEQHFSASMLGIFAGIALLLVAVGIYGVLSYSVSQRTREIGIRSALGAERSDILRLVISEGLLLTFIGLGAGILAALGLTRVLGGLLYGIHAKDPLTFAVLSLLLMGVALLASYIPARRATKVDPMVALRYE